MEGNAYWIIAKILPAHYRDQAEWRAYLCKDCLETGKCKECGCKTPQMFYAPNKKDKLDKWGPMLSKKEWEKMKPTIPYFNDSNSIINDMDHDVSEGTK